MSVIMTLTSVITTRTNVMTTRTSVIPTRTRLISTRKVQFPPAESNFDTYAGKLIPTRKVYFLHAVCFQQARM
jgi:hypothetical protein